MRPDNADQPPGGTPITTIPAPFPQSYWVIPDKLLGGCYPGSKDPKEGTYKLNGGIRHVINLMEPDESQVEILRLDDGICNELRGLIELVSMKTRPECMLLV